MIRTFKRLGLLILAWGCLGGSAHATDTAFWKPYEADPPTFYLEHFDNPGAPEGRFGGAWQGPTSHVQNESRLFVGGSLFLEGWAKLSALPKERAYIISRSHALNATCGFELFVEPSGAVGLGATNLAGERTEVVSEAGIVSIGEWVHLGALLPESMIRNAYVLYANGREVKRVQGQMKTAVLNVDGKKESAAAPVVVGEGFPGLIDEVRIHTKVAKLWPKPEQAWIGGRSAAPFPPTSAVLAPGHVPVVHVSFEDALATDSKIAAISGTGVYVDGILGKAFRGAFKLSGTIAGGDEGALEFWCRPVGINNYSDQNKTLFSTSLFNFYLFNNSRDLRPLTLIYYDADHKVHFAGDNLGTEVYAGKWDHYLFTWSGGNVEWYINGEKAGATEANFAESVLKSLRFNSTDLFGDIDELYIYDKALSPVEAGNAYLRYVDPSRVQKVRPKLASLRYWYLPTTRELYAQVQAADNATAKSPVRVQLKNAEGKIIFAADAVYSAEPQRFVFPELASGDYALNLKVGTEETEGQTLKRQKFAWEDNQLGITDKVFPPFTPVKAAGALVSVVLRDYKINQFGLCDSIKAKGEEILAAPMRLVALDQNGRELDWRGGVAKLSGKPSMAVYDAKSVCAALGIEARSEIEMDGMIRIKLKLNPVAKALELQRLSLEIPVKESMAMLFHESTDIIRASYAGAMPSGKGEIWSSKQSMRRPEWLNDFTSYIWMGEAERGIAWFAENDKGWITAKNHDAPLMRVIRENGRVVLRVDFVNVPGVVTRPTELVFGIQASPTKPVPADYRSKALTLGNVGLPVHPWGGLSCSWKSPYLDKWEVVDKVIEGRNEGKIDRAWFQNFEKQFDAPKVYGVKSWVDQASLFASRRKPLTSPDPVYFEEMYVLPFIPEYQVFQDEWSRERLAQRSTASIDVYRKSGGREVNPSESTNYSASYQDYSLSLMNEWLKRGVSIYWDNTFLKNTLNPWTSAAYTSSDGRIQPATVLWNERDYMKRTWNLMNEWRRKGVPRPLEFIAHMTNQEILPLFSWSTCSYDIEMSQANYATKFPDTYEPGEPYTPEFLLTESTGLHVGAYPYIVHALFEGQCKLPPEALGSAPGQIESGRREWGMRMVHEIIRGGPESYQWPNQMLEKAVYEFGYGRNDVDVWNYWGDKKAFKIDNEKVKGILLTRRSDHKMFLVLQSWSKNPVVAGVAFEPDVIGFKPGTSVNDAFHNRQLNLNDELLSINLEFPYETGVYIIENRKSDAGVLFHDDFDGGLNPGWDDVSPNTRIENGALRLGPSKARLFKGLGLPDFKEGSLEFSFRIAQIPQGNAEMLTARFPADGVEWNPKNLALSDVKGGILLVGIADPAKGFVWRAITEADGKKRVLGEGVSSAMDSANHRVNVSISNGRYSAAVDGKTVVSAPIPVDTVGSAFGISADRDVAAFGALYLDEIALRSVNPDRVALEVQQKQALTRSVEAVAAQVNVLKHKVTETFGRYEDSEIYRLSMFRNPEVDTAVLLERFSGTADESKRRVLLDLVKELPAREKDHVEAMTKIGQPADRLKEFRRARTQATDFLKKQLPLADENMKVLIGETMGVIQTK